MIGSDEIWKNYEYFVRAAVPEAERFGIRLALHPDDPPLERLGGVSRIFTDLEAIKRGISTVDSPNLGVTFCQACYRLMGERLEDAIPALADKRHKKDGIYSILQLTEAAGNSGGFSRFRYTHTLRQPLSCSHQS